VSAIIIFVVVLVHIRTCIIALVLVSIFVRTHVFVVSRWSHSLGLGEKAIEETLAKIPAGVEIIPLDEEENLAEEGEEDKGRSDPVQNRFARGSSVGCVLHA
jgi:hypothetical protein